MQSSTRIALALSLLAGGCVTRGVHDATLQDLAEARSAAETEQLAAAEMRERIEQDEARMTSLQTALAQQEELVVELDLKRARLEQALLTTKSELESTQARAAMAERELADAMKSRTKLKESVARMSEALGMLAARHLAAQTRVAEYRDMLARFRKMIDAGTLDVRVAGGRMVLTMPMDILFPTGSTRMSAKGKETIAEVGATLATIPAKKFQIEGHTDDVPIHNERFASNWELAAGRSLVVVHALLDAGMAPTQLSAASFAEYEPRSSNDDENGRASNRRIEIVVVPDLSALPGNEELERLSRGA